MIEWLETTDQQITLFLNGFHSPFMDQAMWIITNKFTWIPLYIWIIYLLFKHRQKEAWYWLVGIILLVVATDLLTSSVLKPLIGRLRPCHDPEISQLIHNYKRCGGLYSFVSGHSANSFAIVVIVYLIFSDRLRYVWLMFVFAAIVAYSRIYLGVHYFGDIVVGGIIGAFLAIASHRLIDKIQR